jgi:MoaA/NifB/PqqE/SkfB family radical SAM enzyme
MMTRFYKGYWMATNRCNLDCSYCVLEDSPEQLSKELPLADKLSLLDHLYRCLDFRRLTLSGGEITLLGKKPPADFIALLEHARRYRKPGHQDHLELEIYTNGAFLDEHTADAMAGVVDQVAITLDGNDPGYLERIGRSKGRFKNYYDRALSACELLSGRGIEVKIHSVITRSNLRILGPQLREISQDLARRRAIPAKWKFYQYMSYDDPLRDITHAVTEDEFAAFQTEARKALDESGIELHFKDNREMHESLFNILAYGNAQYMRAGDTWKSSRRTRDLRSYANIDELLAAHDIRKDFFQKFHSFTR